MNNPNPNDHQEFIVYKLESEDVVGFKVINPLLPGECVGLKEKFKGIPQTDPKEHSLLRLLHSEMLKKSAAVFLVLSALSAAPAFSAFTHVDTPEDKILSKGFSSFMDGKDKLALSYFEEVIRINPKNTAAQKGLEKVKVRLRKAEDDKIQKSKWLAKAKYNEGREMMKTGDVVAAIDAYQAAVDALPEHKQSLSELAQIRKKMGKMSDRRRLNLSSYAFARGVIAYLDRDWAKAWRIWSERHQLEPANVALANATARAETKFKRMMLAEQEDFFRRGARAFYEQGLYKESQNAWVKVLALRAEDLEALEGKARSEEAILRAEGKGRDNQIHDLLEQGLEHYASQNWRKSLQSFQQIAKLDPGFSTAKDYIAKLNKHLEAPDYVPVSLNQGESWRANRPSNQGTEEVRVPDKLDNFSDSRKELQSQLNRDPSNIRIQQELDRITRMQDEESERVYKDGLIAYSQGNRSLAIQEWKKVLVINPDHKKAAAALRKARAEEERTADVETQ